MTPTETTGDAALKAKSAVALSSLLAAFVLTGGKLVVGLATNSLGILSEAAHSALDLLASGATLWAVRAADLPPDQRHPYGHGKVEHLAALFESGLLAATCSFVAYEAVSRLFHPADDVRVSVWGFVVLVASMVIDKWRSNALGRAAEEHGSHALEADATHFAADLWSSGAALVGLSGLALAGLFPTDSLAHAILTRFDAGAALAVCAVIAGSIYRLGSEALDALLDGGLETGVTDEITEAVLEVEGIEGVKNVRYRRSGPRTFVDFKVLVPKHLDLETAHQLSHKAARRVRDLLPRADVVVHTQPTGSAGREIPKLARSVAEPLGLSVHGLIYYDHADGKALECHLEVPPELTLREAHDLADRFESELARLAEEPLSIITHIEPRKIKRPMPDEDEMRALISATLAEAPEGILSCDEASIHRTPAGPAVCFTCRLDGATPVDAAHKATHHLAARLRSRAPWLSRVTIHAEPSDKPAKACFTMPGDSSLVIDEGDLPA